jgi:hypothetical protein
VPRFAVEQHLQELFEEGDPQDTAEKTVEVADENLTMLPASDDEELTVFKTAKEDWITRMGRQKREVKGNFYRRKADLFLSRTDPDASPMKRKGADHSHLGYQAHCVVDGTKARITFWESWSPPSRSPRTSPCWTCFGEPSSGGDCGPAG